MLAGLIAPRIRLGFASTMPHLRLDYAWASISCEHYRSSRNHPHCVPRHIIYYFLGFLITVIISGPVGVTSAGLMLVEFCRLKLDGFRTSKCRTGLCFFWQPPLPHSLPLHFLIACLAVRHPKHTFFLLAHFHRSSTVSFLNLSHLTIV